MFWSLKGTQNLLPFDRLSIRLAVGVITGHCKIGRMAERKGYLGNHLSSTPVEYQKRFGLLGR